MRLLCDIDVSIHSVAFSYPMISLVQLFIHTLQYPTTPSAHSDVMLMDMAAGHFAKLELATSMQLDTQFVRDVANIARRKLKESKEASWAGLSSTGLQTHTDRDLDTLNEHAVCSSPFTTPQSVLNPGEACRVLTMADNEPQFHGLSVRRRLLSMILTL